MVVVGWMALMALLLPQLAGERVARAQESPRPVMRALVVGANHGGPGQEPLRFADDDARRFAEVLQEIGGYEPGNIRLLVDATRGELLDALDAERRWLQARSDAGESSVFTFYYSGHARSTALSLHGD